MLALAGFPASVDATAAAPLLAHVPWSVHMGGAWHDGANEVAVGPDGSVYMAARAQSPWPTTPTPPGRGDTGVFVKLSPQGDLLVATQFPANTEGAYGIARDPAGGVYLVGQAWAGSSLITPGAFQTTHGGDVMDAYVARLSDDGNVEWATYLGGSGYDTATAVAVDDEGSAYVVGQTSSPNFPTVSPAQAQSGGYYDTFLTKLTRGGQVAYSTYLGGPDYDAPGGVALDGRRAIVAIDAPPAFPRDKTFGPGGGQFDAGLARVSADGSTIRRLVLGGTNLEHADAVFVTPAGKVVLAGRTWSAGFPVAGSPATAHGGGVDAFLARVDVDAGVLERAVFYDPVVVNGGIVSLAVDAEARAWVSFPTTRLPPLNAVMPHPAGDNDVGVAVFDANFEVLLATHLGGSAREQPNDLALHPDGGIVVAGTTMSPDFPTLGGPQATYGGKLDLFATRLALGCNVTPVPTPTTRATLTGPAGLAGWHRGAGELALSVEPWCSYAATRAAVDGEPLAERVRLTVPEGVHTVTFGSVGLDGAEEPLQSMTARVDRTPPVVTVGQRCSVPLANGWCRVAPLLADVDVADATSGVGTIACRLDGLATSCEGAVSVAQGRHSLVVDATDVAGNPVSSTTALNVDATLPTVSISLPAPAIPGLHVDPVRVRASASDALSGVASIALIVNGVAQPSLDVTLAADGTHEIVARATDLAGNAAEARATAVIDLGAPTTAIRLDGLPGLPGFWRSAVSVTLATAARDVVDTSYSLDGGAWTIGNALTVIDEGAHTLAYRSVDVRGNVEAVRVASFTIDSLAPVSTLEIPPAAESGWIVSAAPVSVTAEDAVSGVAETLASVDGGEPVSASSLLLADGERSLAYWAVDRAGNAEGAKRTSLRVDRTPPSTVATLAGTLGDAGWWRSDVTLTLAASDATSGVARTLLSIDGAEPVEATTAVLREGRHVARWWSVDRAGNVAPADSLEILVDGTAPLAAFVTPQPGVAYADGAPIATDRSGAPLAASLPGITPDVATVVGRLVLEASAEDTLSGVARVEFRLDGGTVGVARQAPWSFAWDAGSVRVGPHRLEAWAFDEAGNAARAEVRVASAPGLGADGAPT